MSGLERLPYCVPFCRRRRHSEPTCVWICWDRWKRIPLKRRWAYFQAVAERAPGWLSEDGRTPRWMLPGIERQRDRPRYMSAVRRQRSRRRRSRMAERSAGALCGPPIRLRRARFLGGPSPAPRCRTRTTYIVRISDTYAGFTSLTAPRSATLPPVEVYPPGQPLYVADESGACGTYFPIIIAAAETNTITGQLNVSM